MTTIRHADLVDSIAAALQYISYYHPADYIAHLARAYELEQGPAAKDAIAQILTNSRMCAEGRRPICQDTGIVNVFLEVGMDVRFEGFPGSVEDAVDDGVRKAYLDPDNPLRASVVGDPHFERRNTKDNTPAVVETRLVPGNTVDVTVAAKGGGSENKSKFTMMNPSDSLVDWVLKTVPTMGAGWCPPGLLGIGIGGTAERAMLLAKKSLMDPIDMTELKQRGAENATEALRIELCDKINALGIGAQGLGGLTTVLDVKIAMAPTHAASKPVALIPNCAATRHAHFVLDGSGPAYLEPPSLDLWPDVEWAPDQQSKRVDLDTLTREHRRQRVLIVAHQVIVNCLRYLLDRMDEQQILAIDRDADVPNCSVTSYEFDPRAGRAGKLLPRLVNFVAPLEEAGAPVTAAPDVPAAPKS